MMLKTGLVEENQFVSHAPEPHCKGGVSRNVIIVHHRLNDPGCF